MAIRNVKTGEYSENKGLTFSGWCGVSAYSRYQAVCSKRMCLDNVDILLEDSIWNQKNNVPLYFPASHLF